ncbi:MAG: heptose I phosphotransferase [Myxococcota bacterium]|jgi:heptose I phosphotransferase
MISARDPEKYQKDFLSTVSLDNGRVLACEKDLVELEKLGLDTLEGAMNFNGGVVVRAAGVRTTYKVEAGDEIWFVKIHKNIGWRSRLSVVGSRLVSPGHREWDSANMLRRSGFDVLEPVAFGESINFLSCPRRSFIVTREVKGPPLDELLADGYPEVWGQSETEARRNLVEDMAGMIKRFHSAGYYHKDLYCCHLIVAVDQHEKDKRWGQPHLIDLERVVRERQPNTRWFVKDLAALNFSAPATVSLIDRWRFLKNYFPSLPKGERKKWARLIFAKTAKIANHTPKFK